MFVFPEDKPIICGIRSIYVRTPILVKYYQEQIDAGCIHWQSGKAEGVLFFKNKALCNGFFRGPELVLSGMPAVDYISQSSPPYDFTIDVFEISSEQISLWAGLQTAQAIHSNLSTEFTDLKKLIAKMTGENLTGYIEITIRSSNENSRIFLANGTFMGGTYSWIRNRLSHNKEHIEELISKTLAAEGVFNVYRVSTSATALAPTEKSPAKTAEIVAPPESLGALEELLAISESLIAADKRIKSDFHTLLNKKFVQHVAKYSFLDPFSGEFKYHGGKITFTGDTDVKLLANGLLFSIISLINDLHLRPAFDKKLIEWRNKHQDCLL